VTGSRAAGASGRRFPLLLTVLAAVATRLALSTLLHEDRETATSLNGAVTGNAALGAT